MTRFLACVAGPEEAAVALAEGADIIEVTDPSQGVLGAPTAEVVRATVAAVAGRRPVCVSLGDSPADAPALAEALGQGADMLRIGIPAGSEHAIEALAPLAARRQVIATLLADRPPEPGLVPRLARAGFAAAMLDTREKHGAQPGTGAGGGHRLLALRGMPGLRHFVARCREHGIPSGLAGGIEVPDVPRLLVLAPDMLGFRAALCAGEDRAGPLAAEAVRHIRSLIPIAARRTAPAGFPPLLETFELAAEGGPTDRIFVHDLVLPVRIGAYAHERDAPQDVRFNIDVLVRRLDHATTSMRDVVSYDVIGDAVRMLIAIGHVDFQETLAEQIAATLLAHPRILRVFVRLEKLGTGSGIVGVAIDRSRDTADGASDHLFPEG